MFMDTRRITRRSYWLGRDIIWLKSSNFYGCFRQETDSCKNLSKHFFYPKSHLTVCTWIFVSKLKPLWSLNPRNHRTCLPAISSYPRNWKKTMKGRRFGNIEGIKTEPPPILKASRNALRIGAGINLLYLRVKTWRCQYCNQLRN